MANWMTKLDKLMFPEEQNLDDMLKSSKEAKTHDVGVINSKTGGGLLARDTGIIESFAYYHLGFRMDPSKMMFSIYAPNIQFVCNEFQVIDAEKAADFDPINKEYQEVLNLIGGKTNGEV